MKKQIMSIAAIAAIFTTGASAFDAQRTTAIAGLETNPSTFVRSTMNITNMVTAGTPIVVGQADQTGDALIYPAYFSQKGWETEFSVINNSNTEAVIAKVVLYSAKDSKELRDFNIYLSANDVFRATIKDGELISTDSSTRASAQDSVSEDINYYENTGYTRKDSAPMATTSEPFTTTVDEAVGYIAVFAMAQADSVESTDGNSTSDESYATYHHKHNELWKDYRHMLDQCRGEGWRTTSNNYGGIFRTSDMSVPNIDLNGTNQVDSTSGYNNGLQCGTVYTTQHSKAALASNNRRVHFKSPDNDIISGSVLVKGDDSRGTRSLLLPATAIANFTEDATNVGLLWTEGELANIADRCLEDGGNTPAIANDVQYKTQCLADDAAAFKISRTNYEFRDVENTQLLITQPYKRVLVQVENKSGAAPALGTYHGDADFATLYSYYNNGVKRAENSNDVIKNVTNYGQFDLAQPAIYDDNEQRSTTTSDGYIVSPAPIQAETPGIPNELSIFNPLGSYDDSKSGFARINYEANAHGIVTQMSASYVGENVEVNWIYPVTSN